jgi:hypothetical protein
MKMLRIILTDFKSHIPVPLFRLEAQRKIIRHSSSSPRFVNNASKQPASQNNYPFPVMPDPVMRHSEKPAPSKKEAEAATDIQRIFRGHQGRKEANAIRKENIMKIFDKLCSS